MRVLTVTSDNYVDNTCLLLSSLRRWHPDLPVVIYTLDTGWKVEDEARLTAFGAQLKRFEEHGQTGNRTSWSGGGIFNAYKLHVMHEQTEPFLFLDSDILVLRPLNRLFDQIHQQGWMTSHDGVLLGDYAQGPIATIVKVPEQDARQRGFNTGVVGCDPSRHREVLSLSCEWAGQISENFLGDQGLLNLAWYHLHRNVPANADNRYNGGWREDDRIELRNTIIHFARRNYGGASKLRDQRRVWEQWPKDVVLTDLIDTDFWRESLPHPWPWLNQCNQRKYRGFVANMREASRSLLGTPGLFIDDADQAFLLDSQVLAEQDRWWAQHAPAFRNVPHKPTYHLPGNGRPASRLKHRFERLRRWVG